MSDRKQYTPSPTPNRIDAAWLQQEFRRISQALALIDAALIDLDNRLKVVEEIIIPS